jgi:hypothetical protein
MWLSHRGISGRGMLLRQRARSCETPLSTRPRAQARLDRPHRPAPRRNPELLPMSRATELLRRSTRRTRCECPGTPQAARLHGGLRSPFERPGNRPAATACGYYGTVRRYERGPHAYRNRRFRVVLKDFQGSWHRRIIYVLLSSTISIARSADLFWIKLNQCVVGDFTSGC